MKETKTPDKIFPCYAAYGPEIGERLHYIKKIEQKLRKIHKNDLVIYKYFLPEDNLQNIAEQLSANSLFASHTLACIGNANLITKKKDIQIFADLLKNMGTQVTIIIEADVISLNKGLLDLFNNQAKKICKELDESQKRKWVKEYLVTQEMNIDDESLDFFLLLISGNTYDIKQELDKLILFLSATGNKHIESKHIEDYIYHSREESGFTLFVAYVQRDFVQAMEILNKLRGVGSSQETSILMRMMYHLRQLAILSTLQQKRSLQQRDFINNRIYGSTTIALYRKVLKCLDAVTIKQHIILSNESEMLLRKHKTAIHPHIIYMWLYGLFFPYTPFSENKKLFMVDHHRFL